ncbi:glycosyltransferase family 2 protein [Sphingomonas parva]|nr:glycosyltransferase [Sphingomonas parva]
MKKVSIVIPTRNRAELLPATLESAFAAASDAEIIVVDDASTDDTEAVCRGTPGLTYIRLREQKGTSTARNEAIRASAAEFVAFLDDDDLRLPGSIDRQLAILDRAGESALICGRAFIGEPQYSLPTGWLVPDQGVVGDAFWQLLEANFIVVSTVVARRRVLLDCGLFDPELPTLEDYDLWVRLAEKYRFEYLDEPVAVYRARSDVSGQKTSDRAVHDQIHKDLHRRLLALPRAAEAPARWRRRVHRKHMAIIYDSLVYDAARSLLTGNVEAARSWLIAAMRMKPWHPKAPGSLLWLHLRKKHLQYEPSRVPTVPVMSIERRLG